MTIGVGTITIPASLGARPTLVRWRILAWIVVASLVAYVLRFNLSVAAPAMMRDLGLRERMSFSVPSPGPMDSSRRPAECWENDWARA